MILRAPSLPGYSNLTFTARLCQYSINNNYLYLCTAYNVTANITLTVLPRVVTVTFNFFFNIPAHETGRMKLILIPSQTIDWLFSRHPPAFPDSGVAGVYATAFNLQQPCDTDIMSPGEGFSACPYVNNGNGISWVNIGMYPSLRLRANIPCYVRTTACANLPQELTAFNLINQTPFTNLCGYNNTVRILDTTNNLEVISPDFFEVVPNSTIYTFWFPNPCYTNSTPTLSTCLFALSRLVLPLAAVTDTVVPVEIFYHLGGPGSDFAAETQLYAHLPVPYHPEFVFLDITSPTINDTAPIHGISIRFLAPVRWYYSLPVTDPLLTPPSFTQMPFSAFPSDVSALYYSYVLPGVYLGGVFLQPNYTCTPLPLSFYYQNSSIVDWRSVFNVTCFPTPVIPPPPFQQIPCFGSNSIVVSDNSMHARYHGDTGFLLLPDTTFAVTFEPPCTHCVIHLTHLTLPLVRLYATVTTITVAVALMQRTSLQGATPVYFNLNPSLNAPYANLVTFHTTYLVNDHGFYTILLPNSFTLPAITDPSLTYALLVRSSQPVVWLDGLQPDFSLMPQQKPLTTRLLALNPTTGIFVLSVEIPGVWLRAWAEPFQQCLPTPSTTPTRTPNGLGAGGNIGFPQVSMIPVPFPSGSVLPSLAALPTGSSIPVSVWRVGVAFSLVACVRAQSRRPPA